MLSGTRLVLSKRYTIEELYDLLKEVEFDAGKAFLVSQGPTKWIVFPQIDRHNQVVIEGRNGTFYAQRSAQPLEITDNSGKHSRYSLSNFLSGFSETYDGARKRCEQLASAVGRQINGMNL